MNQLITYDAPAGAVLRDDYKVSVRTPGGEWQNIPVYEVRVDMHHVREASMAYFDMQGEVEVEIKYHGDLKEAVIRPLSTQLPFSLFQDTVQFTLNRPLKLSVECNGDRFGNLHLFANPLEKDIPDLSSPDVRVVRPGIHRVPDLLRNLPGTLYFTPGMHYIEETLLQIPSGKTVYLAGGAVLVGSLVCDHVQNVEIRGRGVLYLADFHRFSAFRGIRIVYSSNISVEGITVVDPPHYSIFIGQSYGIEIRNFKAFSTRGWSDGIDMMASGNIDIRDVFMRNSDDCIAVYGSRWDYRGGTNDVMVRDSILWADVAHPMMIGIHGNHEEDGDIIENLRFDNIDILEHHEPQPNYWGAMAINAGDSNTVRDVVFNNIRIETIESGQLFDIRVVHNQDYNPNPGRRIENVLFKDIQYPGGTLNPSRIHGFDDDRTVNGITFDNLRIGEERILNRDHPALEINGYARNIKFI
ncbi:glycosyl hydrolase family 28 protein [Paenibacillus sp. FSL M7-0896]|uniref:glycosyl hydrolase family 28 protein n=1 Tax=Paenibacillus sp. FSL M7-0896 TaxID=2921610 RepID=UPI0030DB82B8